MRKRFTADDILNSACGKLNVDLPAKVEAAPVPEAIPVKVSKATALVHIDAVLTRMGIDYQTELRFHKPRRFRFDRAIADRMIAIEYEGLASEKSRHTTAAGYTKDAEKYNLAQIDGWTVLRYTWKNFRQFDDDITALLKTTNNEC